MADEFSRNDSRLEWWFVHGRFAGDRVEERYFMAAIFRFQIPDEQDRPMDAFSGLLSILDPRTGRQSSSSRVDRAVVDELRRPGGARIERFAPQYMLDEICEFGLPREFECPAERPKLSANAACFRWKDLTLRAVTGGFELEFEEPGSGRPLRMTLAPECKRLSIDAARTVWEPDEAMSYVTYPQMRLTGTAGNESMQGEAWFDHQWGGLSWLHNADPQPRLRGWDWLGFRLDCGSSGVVMSHWYAGSPEGSRRHLILRNAGGEVRQTQDFEWEPLRWWTSLRSRSTHPVEWRLRVPAWDLDLRFTPFADDQELPVFGSIRAIWEGAGRVQGRFQGRPVSGDARLEGHGRGYVFQAADYLQGWARLVDRELARFLPRVIEEQDLRRFAGPARWHYEPAAFTNALSGPLWDLMDRDGKRWRAVFAYLMLDALGRDPASVLDVIFVLPEMLHNSSLIIDDIQDDSTLRRGQETIHRRYGLDMAISAANTAYFLPMLPVLDSTVLTSAEKQALSEAYLRQLARAHLGQTLDLFWTRNLNAENLDRWMSDSMGPKILQMYSLKTGAPVEALAEAACGLAGAGAETRAALVEFACAFGVGFQLIDDLKNFSGVRTWGKQRGEDLRDGKLTYVILTALQRLPEPERGMLREILCRPELRTDPERLNAGIDLVLRSGACEQVRAEARALVRAAWEVLSERVPASNSKMELRFLWESLLEFTPDQAPLES